MLENWTEETYDKWVKYFMEYSDIYPLEGLREIDSRINSFESVINSLKEKEEYGIIENIFLAMKRYKLDEKVEYDEYYIKFIDREKSDCIKLLENDELLKRYIKLKKLNK